MVFPQFKVVERGQDEEALRYIAHLGSGCDLVEEFIACGVWPLAHGWALGEIIPRRMPTLGDKLVRSPAFVVDLWGWDAAAFMRELESEVVKIVGKYAPKTEMLRSWDIRGSNVKFNCVFKLNKLPYGPYLEGDSTDVGDDRGKQVKPQADEGSSKEKASIAAARNRKIGMGDVETGPRATWSFVEELMETCAIPRELMSSSELRKLLRAY